MNQRYLKWPVLKIPKSTNYTFPYGKFPDTLIHVFIQSQIFCFLETDSGSEGRKSLTQNWQPNLFYVPKRESKTLFTGIMWHTLTRCFNLYIGMQSRDSYQGCFPYSLYKTWNKSNMDMTVFYLMFALRIVHTAYDCLWCNVFLAITFNRPQRI